VLAVTNRARAWTALVAVVVVVGVVPYAMDRDSFPLSTYPMFAEQRTSAETVDTAVGIAGDKVLRLGAERIAGADEPILAAATVSAAIANGGADGLCRDVAARVANEGPREATIVEVITERYDAVAWFDGDHTPLERVVHARCAVAGPNS
jgi:hypothetical protein